MMYANVAVRIPTFFCFAAASGSGCGGEGFRLEARMLAQGLQTNHQRGRAFCYGNTGLRKGTPGLIPRP